MPADTDLLDVIRRDIEHNGPMPLGEYFAQSNAAYYARSHVIGKAGDFITAPEISQTFGELIGLWLTAIIQQRPQKNVHSPNDIPDDHDIKLSPHKRPGLDKVDDGDPAPCFPAIIELGPGRGTLSTDIYHILNRFGFNPDLHLVEQSPSLRAIQAQRLPHAHWHNDINSLPKTQPLLIIANEFFDALPIEQDIYENGEWRRRHIGLMDNRLYWHNMASHKTKEPYPSLQNVDSQSINTAQAVTKNLTKSSSAPPRPLQNNDRPASKAKAPTFPLNGTIREYSPARKEYFTRLCKIIKRQGGAVLIIDYGYIEPSHGDSLQAVKNHHYIDPLNAPGGADLTAHVDFSALLNIARSQQLNAHGPLTQRQWLIHMGIGTRLHQMIQANPEQAEKLRASVNRLTAPEAMGTIFKVIAASHPQWPSHLGFTGL